jgi:hypothetical protein
MPMTERIVGRARAWRAGWPAKALACVASACASFSCVAGISIVGALDPADPQAVYLYTFTLPAPATISIQSWGYGGTAAAPGGVNLAGAIISPGGFDPYVSVFSGTGPSATFLASNDDGLCPPGSPAVGQCYDSALALTLPAGSYTVAMTSFLNMSFAENYGSGTLGDGFIALGSFGDSSSAFAFDIAGGGVGTPVVQSKASRKPHGGAGTFDLPLIP